MEQRFYKRRYDPEMGMYVKKHIYGEGFSDILKKVGSKVFNETVKQGIKKGSEKAITTAVEKTGNYAANKAGEKIVELLSKKNKSTPVMVDTKTEIPGLSQYTIDERVGNLLSGGKLKRKINFM